MSEVFYPKCDCASGQEGYSGEWVLYPCANYPKCPVGEASRIRRQNLGLKELGA